LYSISTLWDKDLLCTTALLATESMNLATTLTDIQLQSNDIPPQVFLTSYYSALSSDERSCSDTQRLTASDIDWINSKEGELNTVIASSIAPFSFAHYVPLDFTGHELCSSDPWVQGTQAAAPFHPTAEGQDAIARAILGSIRQTQGLTWVAR